MLCFSPRARFFLYRGFFFRSSGHWVEGDGGGGGGGLRGFAQRTKVLYTHPHTYIYIYTRAGEVSPSVRRPSSPSRPLDGSRTDVVQFVCDGPNTSPVDTRQQYITRPTVQTVVPAPAATTYPPLTRFPFACNLGCVYTEELCRAPAYKSGGVAVDGPPPRCQIYDFRALTVKISSGHATRSRWFIYIITIIIRHVLVQGRTNFAS